LEEFAKKKLFKKKKKLRFKHTHVTALKKIRSRGQQRGGVLKARKH